ncbi:MULTISPECIES: putative quinol monooxygenase [Paraburkholderia]|jgi:quinol monooxygenase YgiN|uniref:putative quinol monooxygenase n=1 Tax=Paraburkholderia TaxID=1822464 RepID=UPI000D686E12|nr:MULTISPECIES: putative quinol monooxygenase [Paraburkholderia]MDR6382119.1 quinol monooxygenase YgiN [Paraburkholderia caribensis]GJH02802.1 antibiotic biosynthesis monooxygenase [Paraburkholderia terrae]
MIILNVFFKVKEDSKRNFLGLLENMVVESNKEDGCIYYELWIDAKNPNHYSLIEHWRDQATLTAHGKTSHWIHFNDTVNNYLEEKYDEHHYTEIPF